MNASPKVSVLIPVYNRASFIAQTLGSALGQTFSDLEVVVVDNCSTDGTWEVIQQVAARDARVRAFRNEQNIGPVRNWLRCVGEARGEFGKILWSDDLIRQDYLAQAIPALEDPAVGFVYSPARIFHGDQPDLGKVLYDSLPAGAHPAMTYIEGALLGMDFPQSPGCAMFRLRDMRECLLEQVPNRIGSDFSMHAIGNDLLLFLLVAQRYPRFVRLEEPLSSFRDHPGSISISSSRGKMLLHYDVAKAWFVSQALLPQEIAARFNALLCLDLLLFYRNPFGIRRMSDFYPADGQRPISLLFLFSRVAGMAVNFLRRRLGRG